MLPRTAFQVLRMVARSFRKSFREYHASAKPSACFTLYSEKHISETIPRDPRNYFRIQVSIDKRKKNRGSIVASDKNGPNETANTYYS